MLTRRRFLALAGGSAAVVAGGGVAGRWTAGREPRVDEHEVHLERLPDDFDGFRILFMTDVHAGDNMDGARMSALVRFTNSLAADVVILGGDMLDGRAELAEVRGFSRAFRDLRAPEGVHAAAGNHEYFVGIERSLVAYEDAGLTLLRGDYRTIERPGGALALLFVDDPRVLDFDPPQDEAVSALRARVPNGPVPILVAHRPAAFDAAARLGIPLTLSGHTHGGQIGLPLTTLTPVRLVTRYVKGRYEREGAQLIVSPGVGTTSGVPVRFGVPPAVTLVTLRARKAAIDDHLNGASETPHRGAA